MRKRGVLNYIWIQKKTAQKACLFRPAQLDNGINLSYISITLAAKLRNVHRPRLVRGRVRFTPPRPLPKCRAQSFSRSF